MYAGILKTLQYLRGISSLGEIHIAQKISIFHIPHLLLHLSANGNSVHPRPAQTSWGIQQTYMDTSLCYQYWTYLSEGKLKETHLSTVPNYKLYIFNKKFKDLTAAWLTVFVYTCLQEELPFIRASEKWHNSEHIQYTIKENQSFTMNTKFSKDSLLS